jgi:hypothetical protein
MRCSQVRLRYTPLVHLRLSLPGMPEAVGVGVRHLGDVPVAALRLTVGRTQSWVRTADSGNRLRCHFCSQCGSRLWHQADGRELDTLSIKGGSLDQPIDLADAIHIWVSRKLSGVIITQGAQQFPGEPP